MKLYAGTLSPPTAITSSCTGSFTDPLAHEVVVVRGSSVLELWRIAASSATSADDFQSSSHVSQIGRLSTFSTIASVSTFRLEGEGGRDRDVLIVTGESGFISVLRYTAGTDVTGAQRSAAPISMLEDYSVCEGASPFYPMQYAPLHSTTFHNLQDQPAPVIGGGWERLFHTKVDRSALHASWSPLCSPNSHVAVQPNCFMIAAIEKNKICVQLGKLSATALRYEKAVSADADGADDMGDESEKGTSTFVSPCAIPNVQRLNNTNVEVKRAYYLSSAADARNDRICLSVVPLALFRVYAPDGSAQHAAGAKARENFSYFAALEMRRRTKESAEPEKHGAAHKLLVLYEFNPLNHAINQLATAPVDPTAYALFALPAGTVQLSANGDETAEKNALAKFTGCPGGLLLCTAKACQWVNPLQLLGASSSKLNTVTVQIPQRFDQPRDAPAQIVCGSLKASLGRDGNGVCTGVLQNSLGDLFQVKLSVVTYLEGNLLDKSIGLTKQAQVYDFSINYFDTVPVARALHFTHDGKALLAISEASDHILYAIRDSAQGFSGVKPHQIGLAWVHSDRPQQYEPIVESDSFNKSRTHTLVFHPKALENLRALQAMPNCTGMAQLQHFAISTDVDGISHPSSRLVGLCGQGGAGSIVHFTAAMPASLKSHKDLGSNFPVKLFALTPKQQRKGHHARQISENPHLLVFSYFDGTLVYGLDDSLAVGDTVLNAPSDGSADAPQQPEVPIPFDNPTLATTVLANGDYVQIQKHKLVHFVAGQFRFWKPPAGSTMFLAAANASQIVVAIEKTEDSSAKTDKTYFFEYFRQEESGVLHDPVKLPLSRRPLCLALASRTSLDACAPFLVAAFEGGRLEVWELGRGLIGAAEAIYCILVLNVPFPVASLSLLANDCENTLNCVERMESASGVFQRAQQWSLLVGFANGLVEEKILFEEHAGDVTLRALGNQQYQAISSGAQGHTSSLRLRASAMFPLGTAPVKLQCFSQEIAASVALAGRSSKIVSMRLNAAIAVSSATWLLTFPVTYLTGAAEEVAQWHRPMSRVKLIDEPVQDACFVGAVGAPAPLASGESTQTVWKFRFAVLLARSSALIVIEFSSADIQGFPLAAHQCLPLLESIRGPMTAGLGFPLCAPREDAVNPQRFQITKSSCAATPRRIVGVPSTALAIVIESAHRSAPAAEVDEQRAALLEKIGAQVKQSLDGLVHPENAPQQRAPDGKWVSFLRVVDLSTTRDIAGEISGNSLKNPLDSINEGAGITKDIMELDGNLAALSLCWIDGTNTFLVGAVRDYHPQRKSYTTGSLLLFSCTPPAQSADTEDAEPYIELLHSTDIDGIPQALCPIRSSDSDKADYVAVGVGETLCIYAIGQAHMLRKYTHPPFASHITAIRSIANRLFIADAMHSVLFARISLKTDGGMPQCKVFADDCVMRWVTAMEVLDYHTVAAADKFGNFFVLRVDKEADDSFDPPAESDTDSLLKQINYLNRTNFYAAGGNAPFLNACRQKGALVAHYYVGDIITSLQKTTMDVGLPEPITDFAEKSLKNLEEDNPTALDGSMPSNAAALSDFEAQRLASATPVILYGTISGAIGYFTPIRSTADAQILEKAQLFFEQCGPLRCVERTEGGEEHVRIMPPAAFPFTASGSSIVDNSFAFSMNLSENAVLGRDHTRYRSMHGPSTGVVDGDFLQQSMRLWSAIAEKTSQADMKVTLEQIVEGGESAQKAVLGVSKILDSFHDSVTQPVLPL